MKEVHNFTEGKILAPLMKFAGPILLAMFSKSMYGAALATIMAQSVSVLLSFIGAALFQIGLGIPASTVVQILLCLLFMFYMLKKQRK
mgnify:CR=1 FL=1